MSSEFLFSSFLIIIFESELSLCNKLCILFILFSRVIILFNNNLIISSLTLGYPELIISFEKEIATPYL